MHFTGQPSSRGLRPLAGRVRDRSYPDRGRSGFAAGRILSRSSPRMMHTADPLSTRRESWMGKSNSRVFVAVEDAPVVRTAEPHLNQPTAGSHVAAAGFISHRPQLAARRTCSRGRGGYAAMQFNAVVETNEHAVRLWESLGFTTLRVCTSTKSAASDITTSGRHIHTSPAEAVKAGA